MITLAAVATLALPWWVRAPLLLPLLTSVLCLRRFVLLRGPRALRALRWDGQGGFELRLRGSRCWLPAKPRHCLRYGPALWLLELKTETGDYGLLLDPGLQEPAVMRALSRSLGWGAGQGAGPPEAAKLLPSRPKV